MKLVIGLVGEKGSGKETFGDILEKLLPGEKIVRIRSSDILAETLTLWGIPKTRENLQDLAIIMDGHFGDGTLSNAVAKRINSLKADIVIFDGVRWLTDVTLIKSFPKNYLIYVTASLKLRFNRLRARKQKADEKSLTYKQFLHEENKKTEKFISEIAEGADFKIENDSTLPDFKKRIKSLPFLT